MSILYKENIHCCKYILKEQVEIMIQHSQKKFQPVYVADVLENNISEADRRQLAPDNSCCCGNNQDKLIFTRNKTR